MAIGTLQTSSQRIAGGVLALSLAGLLLAYVFRATDPALLVRGLAHLRWGWLALAVAAHVTAACVQGARLRVFANECGRLRLRHAMLMMPVVYAAANVLPLRGSELVKARLLVRLGGLSYTRSAGAITADHAFAALGLVTLGAGLFFIGGEARWLATFLLAGAGFVAAALAAALVLERRRARPAASRSRFERFAHTFGESLRIFVKPREAGAALTLTAAAWALEWLVGFAVLHAVGIEPAGLRAALLLIGVNAAGLLPLTPGQAGLYELAASFVLTRSGVDASSAALAALLCHLAHVMPALLIAGTLLVTNGAIRGAALRKGGGAKEVVQ